VPDLERDGIVPAWVGSERNRLRLVSLGLGLAWGGLGVLILTALGVTWRGFLGPRDSAYVTFGVTMGMALGTVHAGEFWRRRARRVALSRHDVVHFSITWGFRAVGLGILWGAGLVLLGLLSVASVGGMVGWLVLSVFALLFQGALVGLLSVIPAGILMAPLTVFVWHRTLERIGR
jgi:hypothetical protein